jgi:type IV secretory pathway TraG/TraD family ATPase VirD4
VLLLVLGLLVIVGGRLFASRATAAETHRRGARVVTLKRARGKSPVPPGHRNATPLTLAGVVINALDETKHFKFIGTTGTGKSTAIHELLAQALARGDRAVVTDPDGGYLQRCYDRYRGDAILNPFEPRSVKWDPFAEIHHPYDVEQLVSGLIPSTEDSSGREWRGYARTFLSAVVRRCSQMPQCDSAELWRLIAIASSDELRPVIAGTPAQPFLEPDNARMFGSIRSVTASAVAALEYIQAQRAAAFSVREWINKGRGVLFIPYQARQLAALRSIIATWTRLAIYEAMSGPEGDQHLWFVVDELDALGAIDGLKDALARLRKFGGRCVLGFQSVAQVSSTYGAGEAQTVVENCANTLILRCSASEGGGTSHFASRLIGDREVVRRQITRGRDRESIFSGRNSRRSTQVSDQHVTEVAVMPSELEQLPDLTGYLKTASARAWTQVFITR